MSVNLKESEIQELEKYNAQRNIVSLTLALFGLGVGYWFFKNTKAQKKQYLKYMLGGAIVLGGGYRLLTMNKTKKIKNAIKEKKLMIEQGTTKPAPAPSQIDTVPTTVVELTPTGTPQSTKGMIYKN